MIIFFAILFALALGFAIFLLLKNKRLEADVLRTKNEAQSSVTEAQNSAYQKIAAMQQESQAAVVEAQKLIDQQFAEMQQESERVRQHYETESRKIQEAADALVSKTIKDFEPLRKYEKLRDAEAEAQRQLADALKEATSLRAEAQSLLEQAKTAASSERSQAVQRAKALRDQRVVAGVLPGRGSGSAVVWQNVTKSLRQGHRATLRKPASPYPPAPSPKSDGCQV